MGRPSGTHFSVRSITSAGLAALAVLCLAVAGGIGWVATELRATSSALVRDAESLRLVTLVELYLLDYQRLSVFQDDPVAVTERQEVRRLLEASLDEALRYSADSSEAAIVERAAGSIDEFIERRRGLERQGVGPLQIQQEGRASLSRALADLDELYVMNRGEVAAAYRRAQQVGNFFIGAAVLTVILAAALLVVAALAIHHMLLRPILDLRRTIDQYRSGEGMAQADERAPRELSDIARAFNEMSAELGRQKARQLAFIAGIAHDLRNPLSALQHGIDALQTRDRSADDATGSTLDLVGRQLDHLNRMVDDLMQTSVVEAGQLVLEPSVFDLREAVDSVLGLYRSTMTGRTVEIEQGGNPALVRADRMRIEQVVGNLLSNAIKYSPADSPICIEITTSGESVQLVIEDRGIGIAPEEIDCIFEPFWRSNVAAQHSGSGLGLSVARKIAGAHGGTLRADSVPGSGSVFRLTLPAFERPAEGREAV